MCTIHFLFFYATSREFGRNLGPPTSSSGLRWTDNDNVLWSVLKRIRLKKQDLFTYHICVSKSVSKTFCKIINTKTILYILNPTQSCFSIQVMYSHICQYLLYISSSICIRFINDSRKKRGQVENHTCRF